MPGEHLDCEIPIGRAIYNGLENLGRYRALEINFQGMTNPVSFRHFKTSPEIIQLAVMLYVRFPLSLRNVEDLLHERGAIFDHGS
jgi:hypothetical protein